jgi:hypothetical protein
MSTLGLIELQRTSECVQHAVRYPVHIPPLQAGVVVDAYTRQ